MPNFSTAGFTSSPIYNTMTAFRTVITPIDTYNQELKHIKYVQCRPRPSDTFWHLCSFTAFLILLPAKCTKDIPRN